MNYQVWLWKDVGIEYKFFFGNIPKQMINYFLINLVGKKNQIWNKYKFKDLTMKKYVQQQLEKTNFLIKKYIRTFKC